jgi:hypothetical protein
MYRIEDQIAQAKRLINGALKHPELLDKMDNYSYNQEEVLKAKVLLEQVMAYQKQKEEEFDIKSTMGFKDDLKEAHRTYIRHLTVAKAVIPQRLQQADTTEKPDGKNVHWLSQAIIFYDNLMYSASELMQHGIEKSELEQAKAMMEAVKAAEEKYKKSEKELRILVEKRDKAYNELLKWMFKFKAISQLVFETEPDKLKHLGVSLES